jgi:hypothetical protein
LHFLKAKFISNKISITIETRLVRNCITQDKFIKGRTPQEMESLLGFPVGYLRGGAIILALCKLPENDEFALAQSYTNVLQDPKLAPAQNASLYTSTEIEVDRRILKRDPLDYLKTMARNCWSDIGTNRLVKVIANKHENSNTPTDSFPPGTGVPQWILVKPIEAVVVKTIAYNEKYL